jgi:hypothetical protein
MAEKKIKVSKLDAAKRQLDCAIALWFRDADEVSIHTLVFAAHGIIQDINAKRGNTDASLLAIAKRHVKPEHVELAMRTMKKAMTFFKHADRDPNDILEFDPAASERLITISLLGLGMLGEQMSDLQRAAIFWDCFHNPQLIRPGVNPALKDFSVVEAANIRKLNKREFLEAAMARLAQERVRD